MKYFRMEVAQDVSQQEANKNQPKRKVVSEVAQVVTFQLQITKTIFFFVITQINRPGMFKKANKTSR